MEKHPLKKKEAEVSGEGPVVGIQHVCTLTEKLQERPAQWDERSCLSTSKLGFDLELKPGGWLSAAGKEAGSVGGQGASTEEGDSLQKSGKA